MTSGADTLDPRLAEADRLQASGDVASAAKIIAEVAASQPQSVAAYARLVRLAIVQRNLDEGVALAQWLIKLEPDAESHALAALALHEAGEPSAARHAEHALADAPANPTALAVASCVRLAAGDAEGAEEAASAALALRPEDVDTRFTHAGALAGLGRTEEAAQALATALETNPLHLASRLALADLAVAGGDPEAGRELLRAGLELLPEGAPAAVGELLRERIA